MFSRGIVTNITSVRGTLHCRKTLIPCRDQLLMCGVYNLKPVGQSRTSLNILQIHSIVWSVVYLRPL
jgi:hypothetical protein